MKTFILAILLAATLSGFVSYSRLEKGNCKAMARGYYFTFQTPGALDLCGEDR